MLFSSNVFLFVFLPLILVMYNCCPRRYRNLVLLAVSLFFYGWGEPIYLLLMIAVIILNYVSGLYIHRLRLQGKDPRRALIPGIAANLLILGFFKYFGFFAEQLQGLIPALGAWEIPQIPLPIGISFYIFQSMSYIIDVYWETVAVQKNVLTFGTYVALFPQLIAGPIVRYRDVARELEERTENLADFTSGIYLFVIGLSKKVLLANPMGNLWNQLQLQPGTACAWFGLAAYTLQIYFDFSGYSDMARGLGRMFGFAFLENFNYPYISASVTEFWRRWHISLSTWFREYVYIPLGGNRKGMARQICNLLIVWALTGLWHGASWNFVLWGLYYAAALILEKLFLLKLLKKLPSAVGHVYTVFVFLLGWALFYFEDFTALSAFFARLFSLQAASVAGWNWMRAYLPLMVTAWIGATPLGSGVLAALGDGTPVRILKILGVLVLLLLCTAVLASQSYNPFIYFRF